VSIPVKSNFFAQQSSKKLNDMKKIILALLCVGLQYISAQKPETVYSFAKEWKEESWYLDQQKAWKKEIDKNKSNQEAWLNYYYATRALSNVVEVSDKYREQRQKIVEEANKTIPKTFAAYFLVHFEKGVGNGDEELLKAAAINDDYPRIVESLMIHYALQNNQELHKKYALKMYQINDLSSSMLNWGYNLLAELEPNAILLTMGDNDTYATWIVQAALNFRTDVSVVNTHLFTIDDYRNQLLKNWNYKPLDVKTQNAVSEDAYSEVYNKIWTHLIDGNRPVSVVSGGVRHFEEKWGDKLFLTGLAYRFSDTPIDNLSIIKRNYEKRYLLDHLKQSFEFHIMNEHDNFIVGSYLPSLIRLYQHYKLSEDKLNAEKYADLIKIVAEKSEKQEEIKAIFE
jgi:hypothetical protein